MANPEWTDPLDWEDTPVGKVVPLHRGRIIRPAPPELHRQVAELDEWLNRPRKRIGRGDRITALAAYALVAMILGYFSAAYVGGGL